MTSILFLVETIQCEKFIDIYRKNKNLFLYSFCAFLKSTSNFEHFGIYMTHIGYVFPKMQTPKDVVR